MASIRDRPHLISQGDDDPSASDDDDDFEPLDPALKRKRSSTQRTPPAKSTKRQKTHSITPRAGPSQPKTQKTEQVLHDEEEEKEDDDFVVCIGQLALPASHLKLRRKNGTRIA